VGRNVGEEPGMKGEKKRLYVAVAKYGEEKVDPGVPTQGEVPL